MKIETTTIRGLAYDLLIEEIHDRDQSGDLLCYFANIYRQDKRGSARLLIRRSRLPETVQAFRNEIQRDGLQAFRRLAHI